MLIPHIIYSIEYGDVGIKRVAKRQKNRVKEEMTKRKHHKGYGFTVAKTPFAVTKHFAAAKGPFAAANQKA